MDTPNQDASRPQERRPFADVEGDLVLELSPTAALVGSTSARTVSFCVSQPTGKWTCDVLEGNKYCYEIHKVVCITLPEEVVEILGDIIGILT